MLLENYLNKIQKDKHDKWIGFDLDGTIAFYSEYSDHKIGPPIASMIEELKSWVSNGYTVKIMTARASDQANIPIIKEWLKENGLPDLEITNIKDPGMLILYDDRAVQVQKNTGRLIGNPSLINMR